MIKLFWIFAVSVSSYGPVAQLGEPAQHNTGPAWTANRTNKSSKNIQNNQIWACSAVGSASHSHCGGRRFESDQVHQKKPWNHKFRGFFATFLEKCWARSSAVSALFSVSAPAPFAPPIQDTRNDHYFCSPPLGKSRKDLEMSDSHPSILYKTVRIPFVQCFQYLRRKHLRDI